MGGHLKVLFSINKHFVWIDYQAVDHIEKRANFMYPLAVNLEQIAILNMLVVKGGDLDQGVVKGDIEVTVRMTEGQTALMRSMKEGEEIERKGRKR